MSIHFHKLRIHDVRRETPECVSIAFHVPDELKKTFEFKQGQSLTIRTTLNGEEVRRTYSICSSPLENEWRVAVKKVEGGIFSTYANTELRNGEEIDVMPPVGKFYTELHPSNEKRYLAFAAGSGITPVISLIKTTLALEPKSTFTLIFGNSRRSSIIFFEELEALKNRYMQRFNLIHVLSREKTDTPVNFGRITVEKLNELNAVVRYDSHDEFFICGPEQMIFCVRDHLLERGVEKDHIHFELFTTPGQKGSEIKHTIPELKKGGPKSLIELKVDGRMITFDIPLNSEASILDAALQQGADLPFACKGGVCCTCKARLISGEVTMDVHWGLEEEEVKQGFILTCQSHPVSDKVSIDFDIK